MAHFHKLLIVVFLLSVSQISITAQGSELSDGDRIRTFGSVVQLIINQGTEDEELGTGFVVDQSGIILTNAHVIANTDLDDPDITVGIFESTIAIPNPIFKARALAVSNIWLVDYEVDVAVLEVFDFVDGVYGGRFDDVEEDDFEVSLTTINAWNPDAEEAESIYLFGYPNFSVNLPTSAQGLLTAFMRNGNIASDVPFGEAGSGGPAINANNQMIGVAQARDAGGDFTSIISISTICDSVPEVCDLLPVLPDEDAPDADVSRRVGDGGFLQCLNARGPSFERGERFVIPFGGGGTYMRTTPSWVTNNQDILLEEGEGGTIIAGPVCGPASKGELIGWFVETDDGDTGWLTEGYIFNVIPWISKPEDVEEWIDYAPEDFECFSYGPNFQVGDEFIVPLGDGPTGLYQFPNQEYSGISIPEGETGIILEGPECAGGSRGLLTSWRVLADDGTSGWVSEGYDESPAPWISPMLEGVTPLDSATSGSTTPRLRSTRVPSPTSTPLILSASNCPGAPDSRLEIGITAIQALNNDPIRVRELPQSGTTVQYLLYPGEEVTIIGGPECNDLNDGSIFLWWNIENDDGFTGWVAEGIDDRYFLEPAESN